MRKTKRSLPAIAGILLLLASCVNASPLPSYREIRSKLADPATSAAQQRAYLATLRGARLDRWPGVVRDVATPTLANDNTALVRLDSTTPGESMSVTLRMNKDQARRYHKGDTFLVSGTVDNASCAACILLATDPQIDSKLTLVALEVKNAKLDVLSE